MKEKRRLQQEGGINGAVGSETGDADDADSDDDDGDLFGDPGPSANMDLS